MFFRLRKMLTSISLFAQQELRVTVWGRGEWANVMLAGAALFECFAVARQLCGALLGAIFEAFGGTS